MKPNWMNSTKRSSVIIAVGLCVLALAGGAAKDDKTSQNPAAAKSNTKKKTVRIEIDYSDGAQKILSAIPWKPRMTLSDAMTYAAAHKHGIKIKTRGKGSIRFLEKIDDLANQGASGPNWVFRVNGKLGDRSYAITPLKPGDAILWKFDTYP